MTNEVKTKLVEHLKMNVRLGVIYLELANKAQHLHMNNLACYLKQLSNDKIVIHKDLIWQYLCDQGEEFSFESATCVLKDHVNMSEIKTVRDIFEFVDRIEGTVIKEKVQELATLCWKENDFETYEFWTWFINDRVKDYGDEWAQLYDAYKLAYSHNGENLNLLELEDAIEHINKKIGVKCERCDCK